MRKQTVAFEWQELPENQELLPIVETFALPPAANPWQQGPRLITAGGALCLLVAALLAAGWVERQAQTNLATLEHELALAVDAEAWQTHQAERSALSLLDSAYSAQSAGEITAVEVQALGRNVAAVTVITHQSEIAALSYAEHSEPVVYRQLRFYRQTEQGWQPTEPIPSLWGQRQSLATEYFDFTYRSRDAQTVQAVAAELDAVYAEMRRNFGLSSTTKQKIVVEVIVGPMPDQWAAPDKITTHVFVASPTLLPVPDSLTHASILRQLILVDLVAKVSLEALHTHKMPGRWQPLLTSLRLWQIWEAGGPLKAWRQPLFRWLYGTLPHEDNDDFSLRPPLIYPQLCAHHHVWLDAPIQAGIPLFYDKLDLAAVDALDHSSFHAPVRLAEFTRLPFYGHEIDYVVHTEQTYIQSRLESIALVSMLDYATTAYGRGSIGALWFALGEHKDWETLIPAVFGVSVEELEAGWQAYLARFRE